MVNISHKDKNGKRQYMHSEYEYSSNQYNDRKFLSSIKLSFDSFLLIEDMDTILDTLFTKEEIRKLGAK